jgi:superfamily II RNA helicase
MKFHYDFALKILLSGRESEELVEGSYWWALEKEAVKEAEKDLLALETQKNANILNEEQKREFEVLEEIVERTASQKQNVRKKAIRDLESWKEEHDSPEWKFAQKKLEKNKEIAEEIQQLERFVSTHNKLEVPGVQDCLGNLLEFGYVKASGGLTEKGKLGSEIHEGHPFLMTEFFLRVRDVETLSREDILTALAVFASDSNTSESENNKVPSELKVSSNIKYEINLMFQDAKKYKEEEHFTVGSKYQYEDYWQVKTDCVELIYDWLTNDENTLGSLAQKYGVFEGNVQKILMKVASLLEELEALATLSGSVEFLKKMEGSRESLLKGIVIAESLYLRL